MPRQVPLHQVASKLIASFYPTLCYHHNIWPNCQRACIGRHWADSRVSDKFYHKTVVLQEIFAIITLGF